VIELAYKIGTKYHWWCLCDCGKLEIIRADYLKAGLTKSCGCLSREKTIERNTEKYFWNNIRKKGRICRRWLLFKNFYKDMGSRPKGHFLERINENRVYSKTNCKWSAYRGKKMSEKSIGIFVDISSIHRNLKYVLNGKLDYKGYYARVEKEGSIYRAFCYGAQIKDEAKRFVGALRMFGFEPKYVQAKKENPQVLLKQIGKVFQLDKDDPIIEGLKSKINMDEEQFGIFNTDRTIDLIIDIFRIIHKLDIVVLGTSNVNIVSMIEFLKEKGIKVIVFSSNIPGVLKASANSWWEIGEDLLEQGEDK